MYYLASCTKPNQIKRKRKKDLRLPLLVVAMTKEHYSMGHVPFRKNDFSTETVVVGGRHKVKHENILFNLENKQKTEWLTIVILLATSLLHVVSFNLSPIVCD